MHSRAAVAAAVFHQRIHSRPAWAAATPFRLPALRRFDRTMSRHHKERGDIIREFKEEAVNMSPDELDEWLSSPESMQVGLHRGMDPESVGHKSGRYIRELLDKPEEQYNDEDLQQMQRVIGYVHRHMAQRPKKPQSVEELENTKWAKSLKNWAHDPGKDEPRAQE